MRPLLGACLLAAAWGLAAAPAAAAPAAGAPGAFLKLGVDARAMGLGGAYTAMAGEISAGYWNPAALAAVFRPGFMATYTILPGTGDYSQLGFALPLATFGFPADARAGSEGAGPAGTLGVTIIRFAAGYDIEARQVDSLNPNYLFADVEGCYGLAFAYPLGGGLAAGLNVKGLYQELDRTTAGGWGLDAGLVWTGPEGLSAGLAVRDAYTRLTWATGYGETFPATVKLGAAYRWPLSERQRLTLTAEAEQNFTRRPMRVRAGAEYGFADIAFLRGGYADGEPAAGAGLRLPWIGWGRTALQLDYALLQDAIDGWDQWVTMKVQF